MKMTLTAAGLLFLLYPVFRPWEDETTAAGAATAMGSGAWLASHLFAMIGFILVPIALLEIHRTAAITFWVGAGLTLPYYGAETFGLHEIAAQPNLLELAEAVRYNPVAATTFAIGLVTMGVAAVMVALKLRTLPAILFAAGFVLFLPQFFTPPSARIAHGVLMIVGCVWLAWDSARREAKDPQLAAS
ncbi:hypothetical protein C8D88_103228 [Lentzea atacamensis]|uniref:Uncharacterized protein n=1 Tax=Lentzea atacamensis TaxID=531938 RepID=A0A316ICH3_9PSEU|nr:hypothetical protein [Lentzea atacamensis]PWK88032.1 hypothetical protein C8D88_103228 [Lentzea atacamensis]RAS71248.1 hypothetical protein C8D87_1011549 [Lentzea atacamensis]